MPIYEHREGYAEERMKVLLYDRKQLLELMDSLPGRPAGWQALSDSALQREALWRLERKWRLPIVVDPGADRGGGA